MTPAKPRARWRSEFGMRPNMQVAIDETWSALRFRPPAMMADHYSHGGGPDTVNVGDVWPEPPGMVWLGSQPVRDGSRPGRGAARAAHRPQPRLVRPTIHSGPRRHGVDRP